MCEHEVCMSALGHWEHLAILEAQAQEQSGLDFERRPLPCHSKPSLIAGIAQGLPGSCLDHTAGSVQDELDGKPEAMPSCPQPRPAQGCSFLSLGSFQKTGM